MTDRHAGYIVVLDADIREDDAQSTIAALKHIKGVQDVTPVTAEHAVTLIAVSRVDHFWRRKLLDLARESSGPYS